MQANKTVEVFCSYAHEDESWLRKLESHLSLLKRQGRIALWHDRLIVPGDDWTKSIDIHLETASVILLLVSADFLSSDYCYGIEMKRALERHQRGEAQVIPILIRQVDWKYAPFAYLRVLPTDTKPLALWEDKDAGLADVSENLRRIIEGEPLTDAGIAHPAPPSIWNIPYRRNPYFTGRDDALEQLDQHFRLIGQNDAVSTRRAALTQPQAIKGLGGIGKTQIAVEYAYRSRDLDRYTQTIWINAANEETLITSFVTIAESLPSFAAKNVTDQRKLVEAVKYWLEECEQRWLLIFDNADDLPIIQQYLPQQGKGDILLTTRADAVGSLATSIQVETMGFLEGTQLLLRRAQRFEHTSDEEINQAGNIVIALDHFPLALDQAGAYIEETQCSFIDYLQMFQTHRKKLLAKRGLQTTNYPNSVATTWSLSFQKVEQANPAAADLLRLCAFLAPDKIPEELLKEGTVHWPPSLQQATTDPFSFDKMIEELLKFSLVKRLEKDRALSIHRLVQVVQRDQMKPETQYQWSENVIRAVNQIFPRGVQDVATWPQCLRYLDQAQVCNTLIEDYLISQMIAETNAQSKWAKKAIFWEKTNSFLGQMKHSLLRVTALRRLVLGRKKYLLIETADLLNRTGLYLHIHGIYSEAEPLYMRALAIREQQLGANHPDTVSSLNNLASLYASQEKYMDDRQQLDRGV